MKDPALQEFLATLCDAPGCFEPATSRSRCATHQNAPDPDTSLHLTVRRGVDGDLSFVFATWLRSYRRSSYFAKRITDAVFFVWHQQVIRRILSRGAAVYIATPEGDPDTILGYLVIERLDAGPVVHFAYTKKAFRRLGVFRCLLEAAKIDPGSSATSFTHWTFDTDTLTRKWPGAVYCPYMI